MKDTRTSQEEVAVPQLKTPVPKPVPLVKGDLYTAEEYARARGMSAAQVDYMRRLHPKMTKTGEEWKDVFKEFGY